MSDPIPHVLGELSTFIDQQLSNSDRQRVEKHLKSCEGCSRHYQDLLALRRMLHASPALKPPESFYQGVLNRIENPTAVPSWFSWGIPAKALASACLVMIVVWVTHETRHGTPPVSKQTEALRAQVSDHREIHTEPANVLSAVEDKEALMGQLKSALEESKASVAPRKKTEEAEDALKQLANTPTQKLDKRSDVKVQARDINGPAYQNSFGGTLSQTSAARRKSAVTTPELGSAAPVAAAAQNSSIAAANLSNEEPKMPAPAIALGGRAAISGAAAKAAMIPELLEWKGTQSGITKFRTAIVENAEEWQTLWHEHTQNITPPPPTPEVDFIHNIVIGVFAGQKPTDGYAVEIVETQQPADVLVVIYKETAPAPGAVQTQVVTEPFHLKVIPQNNSLIQFKKQ